MEGCAMKIILPGIFVILNLVLSANAGIIHVPADYRTIQAGINAAVTGDTVLVADSTYYENIDFKGKRITVASWFILDQDTTHINSTIIDGSQPANPELGSVVTFSGGEDTTSVICGFTITGGTGSFVVPANNVWAGGGILCSNAGARICHNKIINNVVQSPSEADGGGISQGPPNVNTWLVIENNVISANYVSGSTYAFGGGIEILGNARIVNNTISTNEIYSSSNWAPGAGIYFGSDSTLVNRRKIEITGNKIIYNSAQSDASLGAWGGVHGVGSRAVIKDNHIEYNTVKSAGTCYGAGLDLVRLGSGSWVSGNVIRYNQVLEGNCYGGGLRCADGNYPVSNNIIAYNTAMDGAGVLIYLTARIDFMNNTVYGNTASRLGGGLYIEDAVCEIKNSIIRENLSNSSIQIYAAPTGTLNCSYSNIARGWVGTGNIDIVPDFVDMEDFHLQPNSPSVDQGDPDQAFNDREDASHPGYAMLPAQGSIRNDMGAYGGQASLLTAVKPLNHPTLPSSVELRQNYPNPFNPSTSIEFILPRSEFVTVKVYNILGKEVETLVSKKLDSGNHTYRFDGKNLASGIYYYQLVAGEYREVKKMILIK